ncbi:hypothetical protein NE865_02124 [Phthorimaea operculella]|nr:hypothetical protein NE865_02124 [Phthorimaea operculella]
MNSEDNVNNLLQSPSNTDNEYECEYREDIWQSLLQQEAEKPPIHLQSPQLEFRGTLVQQLRDVTNKLGLTLATLHSAVAQLDLFMDAHRLRADRLTHVALACLSIAAKSEEKFNRAPTLKTLSKICDITLCGKTFRQLEWMVGQHVKWRLLAPTPVTFATLLAQFIVTDADLVTRHPKFVRRFKRDGNKLLNAYLDLTLSDVPGRQYSAVAPIARRLHRMMQILKARESTADSEVDQGYGSAWTSPSLTPCTSPVTQVSPATSCTSTTSANSDSYRHRPLDQAEYSVLDMNDSAPPPPPPPPEPATIHPPPEYRYSRSTLLLNASLDPVQPTTSVAVKRGLDDRDEFENKRYRLASHMSQVVL